MNQEITFGQIVKERRNSLGLTQTELARRVGCAPVTIRKIEYDALRPSVQIAERLAVALNIPEAEHLAFVRLARQEPDPSPIPAPTPAPEEIGQQDLSGRAIKGFELGERIGAGGYGAVYRAVQTTVEREVAIKIILPKYANQPEFIRRFEAEAQLVARLEHPHIVPLYDYWREPDVAYLVMRFLRGGSLSDRLRSGPISPERLLPLLEQICAGLDAAHRAGVIHRDIKPANVLLDEGGNAYLADFGIAKNLTEATNGGGQTSGEIVIGSPAYISPEQIMAEPVKPQTDIYSLGVMLYELLTARKPFKGPTPIAYIQQHLNEQLPLIAAQQTAEVLETSEVSAKQAIPTPLDIVIGRATAKDPRERYPDVLSMLADIRRAMAPESTVADIAGEHAGLTTPPHVAAMIELPELANPYKGLRAFSEADAANFFGRDTLIQALLIRMAEESDLSRFLAVVGPSGSGKSSAVKAGLIPALRQGGLPDSDKWFIVEMTPGTHPLEELETALLRVAVNPPDSLLAQLRENERGLHRAVNRILPADGEIELVLVIDQFEEIFTLVEDEELRAHFLNSLVTAALDPRSRVRIVITLRADFTDRPLQYVDFGELVRQQSEFVLPLTPDELEQAITGPTKRAGLSLEAGLVSTIIDDIGDQPGMLPLLQYALTELFERRQGRKLTLAAYRDSGGVLGALARRAEELYAGLDEAGREAARQLFLRLVTLGEGVEDTRRRVLRSEIASLTNDERPMTNVGQKSDPSSSVFRPSSVIDQFGRYRLLTFDHDPVTRGPTVEVAHESLLREWSRLRGWLAESRADIRLQRLLAAATQEWLQAGQNPGFLLRGSRLDQFEHWATGAAVALTQNERVYLEASLSARQARRAEEKARQQRELETAQKLAATEKQAARRLRWLAVGLAIFLLVAAGLAMFAFNQQAIAQADFTRAEAQRLAAEANTLVQAGGNAEMIALLALKSLGTQYSPQGDAALQAAAGLDYPLKILAGHEGSLWAVDYSPDGSFVVTGSGDGTARLWGTTSGKQLRAFIGHEDEVVSVAFGPDGRTVLTGSYDQTARLWDVETGQELRRFVEPDSTYVAVAYSPDGQFVLTGSGNGNSAHLWQADSGELVQTFLPGSEVSGVAVSPDGRLAATTGGQNLYLWDIDSGQRLQTFEGHTDLVIDTAFSPNGRTLASGGYDKTARLWDINTGELLQTFVGHNDAVEKVRFSPNGQTLLTVSDDRTARLWGVATGQEIRQVAGHASSIFGAAFAPDGQSIATASFDQTAKLWAVQAQPEWPVLAGVDSPSFANAIKFSANGDMLIGAGLAGLRLWNSNAGELLHQFEAGPPMLSASISPDGSRVWGGGVNGVLYGWDVESGENVQTLTGHEAEIVGLAVSTDGRYALTAGASDGTVRLWDLEAGEPAQVFNPEAGFVLDVAFSPDGQTALAATASGVVFMWAVGDGQLVRQFKLDGPTGAPSVAVSPDGAGVAVGSRFGPIVLFNAANGQQQRVFSGHTDVVRDLTFSPDGTLLLSASADGTARLWDVTTGMELRRYNRRPFTAHSVAFAPDGRSVLVAANDGQALRYDVDYRQTVTYLCSRLQRDFTDDEQLQYDILNQEPTCPASGP